MADKNWFLVIRSLLIKYKTLGKYEVRASSAPFDAFNR
jgi:hypothetical protein